MKTLQDSLQDLLNKKDEEEKNMSMELPNIRGISEAQAQPTIPNNVPQEQVFTTPKLEDVLPQRQTTNEELKPEVPLLAQAETPPQLSKSEQLLQEYLKLSGKDQEDLRKARETDRMLKIGAAIGDALSTYINAASQKKVKAPGVQVQQGAGLGKIAEMFATSPEVKSDVASRREALLKQYGELAKSERAQARLTSEETRAKRSEDLRRELTKSENEAMLKAAGIRSSGKEEALDLRKQQYSQLGEGQVEKLSVLKESIDESNALLPQLDKTRKSLGIINTPISDIEAKFGKNPEYQTLKQNYSSIRNSIRKAIFGATLTPGEQEEFDNELSKLSISDKNLEGSINNLIGRLKSKARSRLNTIAQTQPLKAETAMNAIKTFGLEESKKEEKLINDNYEPRIEKVLKANPGSTRQQVIDALKKDKKLPADYK